MRTLFVGDVHGCAASLRALVREARPDRLVLLGDLFNKGPDPRGVWDVVRETGAESVLGNHDARMLQVWGQPGESSQHVACRALPDEARAWLASLPLFLHGEGWIAVHAGLHPFLGEAGTTPKMALTLRRWPDDEDPSSPFWWHLWRGPERVIYGHDAMRGLQVHRGSVGLDTGACYGNTLSGYLLEEDRVIEVPGATDRPRAAAR
ncbi:MAG: metallophosphoesterase [Myxococcota bacterium]